MDHKFRTVIASIFTSIYQALRPIFGSRGVCIYPVTCSLYATLQLQEKPFYKAIPLIFFRIISCNPIVALYLLRKHR